MVVGEVRIAIEEKQVGVEELAEATKQPHKELHRPQIDHEPSVNPSPGQGP